MPLLADLPHQRAGFVDPSDAAAVGQLLEELRAELERRLQHGQADSPDLLLVVDDWAELANQGPVLDLIARHGPTAGLFALAATTHVEDASLDGWVRLFDTRLVLHTPDEASSVRLLGEAGAEDLDSVGQLWPLVRGRILHRVRGFRVPPVHLADLVQQMRRRADAQPEQVPPPLQDIFASETDDDDNAGPVGSSAEVETGDTSDVLQQEPSPAPDTVRAGEAAEYLIELRLFGHQSGLVRGRELTPQDSSALLRKYRRGWSLLLAIAALPDTKASVTRIGELLWQQAGDDVELLSNRIQSNLSNARQVLQAAGLSGAEARQMVRTEGGLCLLDRDHVRSDVWEFLDAQRTGHRARAAGREADAIAAYQQARALYAGALLAGQQATHPWTGERVDGGLTLVESYHAQWHELTERLADLLVSTRRYSEAAPLYRELLLDPRALPSRDRDLVETREAHAHALFGCYRALADPAGLEQVFVDLELALQRDDVVGAATSPTRPTPETLSMLEEARQELRARTVSPPAGRPGDPPAAAGD